MRQRDQIKCATVTTKTERPSDRFVKFLERNELGDRQLPDGNDELRLQHLDFVIHPAGAILDFVRSRNAIATGARFSRKAAADGCEVNPSAHVRFWQMAEFLEPAKEGSTGRPGEWPAQNWLPHTWCLTDQNYLAQDRTTGNRWRQHARTAPALQQTGDMTIQQWLIARDRSHSGNRLITGGKLTK
jgi:hypothetical protein